MFGTIAKVLFVCNIFICWAAADNIRVLCIHPNEPTDAVTISQDNYGYINDQVQPATSAFVIGVEEGQFNVFEKRVKGTRNSAADKVEVSEPIVIAAYEAQKREQRTGQLAEEISEFLGENGVAVTVILPGEERYNTLIQRL